MALTGVHVEDAADLTVGEHLAARLGVPVTAGPPMLNFARGAGGARVIVGSRELQLGFNDQSRGKPFAVDFQSPEWRRRLHKPLARGHILRRALGTCATIVDATAGFGGDAVLILNLGVVVTAIERSAAVAAVLGDGVRRAVSEGGALAALFARFTLINDDAVTYLHHLAVDRRPDVVYLDPMFTKLKTKAKSPKDMQLLQEVLPPATEDDDLKLFTAARAAATRRVVVKRALKARALGPEPTHSFKGQSVRYDVYVANSLR